MSAPVVYRSTDGSAPVLTGTAGDLITLLNAILITGYGTQPAAGWTKPFVGTNGAVYKQGGGSGFYLLVNDNAPGAGLAKEARIFPSEGCTAYSATAASSTNLFPTTAQQANGLFVRKSNTADATARPWIAVADDRTLYVFVQTGDGAGVYLAWCFGDIYSLLPSDAYKCIVIARATENSATTTVDKLDVILSNSFAASVAHYIARGYTGTAGSVNVGKHGDSMYAANSLFFVGSLSYPNPTDGSAYASRAYIIDNTTAPTPSRRGWLRGMYHFVHPIASVIDGDTFSPTSGDFAGRTFLVIKLSGNNGVYLVETSNTWDTGA